jgi:glycosyltransferase involved in cell wall biosynthesis
MRFSFVICTYNRDLYIRNCIEALFAQKGCGKELYEVVLVNNNSTDGTHSIALELQEKNTDTDFSYHIEAKQGLSHARNRGAEEAKYEVVVFLDDDAFAHENYVAELSAFYKKHPGVMGTGGKIAPLYESGNEPAWMSKYLISLVSALDMGKVDVLFKKGKFPIGANMSIRKDVFGQIGYFNTTLGRTGANLLGGEEKDIFLRMQDNGMSIWYVANAVVDHIIPEKRTEAAFIKKLGNGIGTSEYLRTKNISQSAYVYAVFKELAVKWGGTLVLASYHLIRLQFAKANMLIRFRYWVSSGLLGLVK